MTNRIVCCLCLVMLVSCVSPLNLGVDAFNRGEYDIAAAHWNELAKTGNPHAQYNVGLLWEGGLGSTPRNRAEASHWYLRSAQQGFVPAMVRLANIQTTDGYKEAALSWYLLAARWGDTDAVSALSRLGERIPPADLLAQKQHQDTASQANAAEAAVYLGASIGCALAGNCGSSGASAPKASYRPQALPSSTVKQCSSDYSCGVGSICVKEPLQSMGVCMMSVDEHGLQKYNTPDRTSIGPNLDIDGQCRFDVNCPVGFRCDTTYKACVKL